MNAFRTLLSMAMCALTCFATIKYSELMINKKAPIDSVFIPMLIYFFGAAISVLVPVILTEYLRKLFGMERNKF